MPPKLFPHIQPRNLDPSRLRHYRLAAGLTQAQAGAQAGFAYPAASWSNYEKSRLKPSPRIISKLANALAVPDAALLVGSTSPLPPIPPENMGRIKGFSSNPELDPSRLRMYRLAADLTQYEAARRANVTAGRWSHLEAGYSARPRPETLNRIAAALGVSPEKLLTTATEPCPLPRRPATRPEAHPITSNAATAPGDPLPPTLDELAAAYDQGYAAGYAAAIAAAAIPPTPDPDTDPLPQPMEETHAPETQPEQLPPAETGNAPANEAGSGRTLDHGPALGPKIIRYNTAD